MSPRWRETLAAAHPHEILKTLLTAVVGLIGFAVEIVGVKRLSPGWRFRYAAILYCVGLVGAVIIGVRARDKQIIFAYGVVLLTALACWIRIAMVSSVRQHKAADDASHST